jgi:long-chain acyl-CoA synthetase
VLFPLVERVCTPLQVEGEKHLTGLEPPLLLASNHASHLDTPLLAHALPPALRRRLAVAAAADYFYARPGLGPVVSLLGGAFPFARRGGGRAGLAYCAELVASGWAVLVYPEGTRSPDGHLQPFRPGIGYLAATLGVPVLPVYLDGAAARLPKGACWPRRGPATVRFGTPLVFPPDTRPAEAAARIEAAVAVLAAPSAA